MKKFLLILAILFSSTQLISQSITSITYSPAAPTPADTIYFYVDLMFPSGSCPLANSTSNLLGSTVMASSLHCVGLLAVICSITDTFIVLPLPAGNYIFDMTLNSGQLPIPCTPGIVPDDNQVLNFAVSVATDLDEIIAPIEVAISPNPSAGLFELKNLNNSNVIVYDVLGNELINKVNLNTTYILDISDKPKGIYLMKVVSNGYTQTHRLLKR